MKSQGKNNVKKSLHTLQHTADGGKENLVGGRRTAGTKPKDTNNVEIIKATPARQENTVPDIFSEEPNITYWKMLAERRRVALKEALEQNEFLIEKVKLLEEENSVLKNLVQDSAHIISYVHDAIHEEYGGECKSQ